MDEIGKQPTIKVEDREKLDWYLPQGKTISGDKSRKKTVTNCDR